MMLRPSISRQEPYTLEALHDALEVRSLKVWGTLSDLQQVWIETYSTFPPHRFNICPIPVQAAA